MHDAISCPRLYPLRVLGRKWSYPVLRALDAPKSFAELQRELRFITNHILTRELKLLQGEKLVLGGGKYRLTEAGRALYAAAEPLHNWSVEHGGKNSCPPNMRCSNCSNYESVIASTIRFRGKT
jgi:DNA-binding HxlR family transcriptional regulator